jgi:hypothetical protein
VQHVLQQQQRWLQPFQLENFRAQVMNFDGLGQQSVQPHDNVAGLR